MTLKTDDIQLGAQATDKVSAIRQVAARLSAAGLVTDAYVDGMLRREEQTAPYLGSGIAIPHGTTDTRDLVLKTEGSGIALSGWGRVGRRPEGLCGDRHAASPMNIWVLRQLTRVLSDDEVTARLPGVQSAAELAALLNGEQLSQPLLLDDSTLLLDFPTPGSPGVAGCGCRGAAECGSSGPGGGEFRAGDCGQPLGARPLVGSCGRGCAAHRRCLCPGQPSPWS